MRSLLRRIAWLEELALRERQEAGPSPAEILLERRRKRALAEGREPEPHREFQLLVDHQGRLLPLADVLLADRKRRYAAPGISPGTAVFKKKRLSTS